MCFSTEASFGAGAVLTAIGIVALRKTDHRKQLLFAAIPIFFAIQQFAEGFVWMSLTNTVKSAYGQIAAYIFLLFALLVWPVWLPLSIWLLETRVKVKRLLLVATGFGVLFSLLLGFYLFNHSVLPEVEGHHIHYAVGFKGMLVKEASLLYFIPTIIPPFLSRWKNIRILGVFLLVSYLVSKFYFADAVVSVWCYLAAFVSIQVLLALHEMQKKESVLENPEQ